MRKSRLFHLWWLPFFLVLAICGNSCAVDLVQRFGFTKDAEGWGIWGEGVGRHIRGLGYSEKGSIELQCNRNQQITMHKKFELPAGRYRVSAWLRALDVKPGKWDYSIWLFYQTSGEIETVVKDLHGTFNWRKITYTIDVGEGGANIWFRLKSSGTLWVDDVRIEPWEGERIPYVLARPAKPFPHANAVGVGQRCENCYRWVDPGVEFCPICGEPLPPVQKKEGRYSARVKSRSIPAERLLIGFEREREGVEKSRHYLRRYSTNAFAGKRSAVIRYGEYNNMRIGDEEMRDWSGYDYLGMDIYSPLNEPVRFAVSISDRENTGYWDKLNHYTTLRQGWNHLKFHVKRYVGERGSVRIKRYLDLSSVKQFWFAVAPEEKRRIKADFLVDNIRLLKAPPSPEGFPGLVLFDFVKEKFRTQPGFIGIQDRHSYHRDVGFGFVDANIWRSHDSVYADTLFRDGLFVNSGEFRVDLPNGRYIVRLVPYGLGEWYEHFWKHRKIMVEGKTVLNESRRDARDYLDDFLRFSEIEPGPDDTPYELYLKKIFREIVVEVEVEDGSLELSFDGDDSGILLNSLVIYPTKSREQGDAFMAALHRLQNAEFETISRQLEPVEAGDLRQPAHQRPGRTGTFQTALIPPDLKVSPNTVLNGEKSGTGEIRFSVARKQRPVQSLLVRNTGEKAVLKAQFSDLVNGDEVLRSRPGWLRYGVLQYQSHTLNHETYELAPRFLRTFPPEGLEMAKDYSRLLWYQIPIAEDVKPGTYRGYLKLSLGKTFVSYPVTLVVKKIVLPDPDIAVGFFGLDPVSFDYYSAPEVKKIKRENRRKVLRILKERGFTTWSSLPSASFVRKNGVLKLAAEEVDGLMKEARSLGFSHKVFTYGGSFPVVLDQYGEIEGMSQEEYRKKTASILKKRMEKKNWLPVVFDVTDEAAGYFQTVERDLRRVRMLEEYFPFLRRGGYSHPMAAGEAGDELNRSLTDISLSRVNDRYRRLFSGPGRSWGSYGNVSGLDSDTYHAFGEELWQLRQQGCSHKLGWHLTLSQNYPYYDLDGRESDAMMLYPRKDGGFDFSINFELATLGLEQYRLKLYQAHSSE